VQTASYLAKPILQMAISSLQISRKPTPLPTLQIEGGRSGEWTGSPIPSPAITGTSLLPRNTSEAGFHRPWGERHSVMRLASSQRLASPRAKLLSQAGWSLETVVPELLLLKKTHVSEGLLRKKVTQSAWTRKPCCDR
jgi:hypothetical protein